ncbi:aminopeptidase P N-terminal domain-containing protein [Chitinophaga sp. OAE865]|uniref:aminopeptidase P N-terminal domain-containing protein n=1 Tax=Chitinophaga sp. OAE865 TaxID=2817898 RepID=UPI001AE6A35D
MYFTKADIDARRARLAAQWNNVLKNDEAILVYSGYPVQKPGGLDQTYPFLPHPSYYWLTGRRREEEVILYNRHTGWIEFQKAWTREQSVWEGEKHDLLVQEPGKDIQHLKSYMETQRFSRVYQLGQVPGNPPVEDNALTLRTLLQQTRRVKDAAEVKLIRHIAGIAAYGYRELEQMIRPGVSEMEVRLAFEMQTFRHGGHAVPYDTIVGSGPNAAILHALPTTRIIGNNEFVLVDAGASVYDYCVDITRTFPSSAAMDTRHKALYELVLSVQQDCISKTLAGTFWHDIHNHAAREFTRGLLSFGILKGDLSGLIEKEVIAAFFPHGLGHLVGLHVRDTGQEENPSPRIYSGARLRVDIQLEAGHLITVEPGLYFIKALLEEPGFVKKYQEDINWNELEHWKHIGGVRIEDNILVTASGNENLTETVPKATHI